MRTKIASLVVAVLLALSSSNASAVALSVVPDVTDVAAGVPFDVAVTVSGLGDFVAPSLGAFDLDVLFDAAIMTPLGVVYGTELDQGLFGSVVIGFGDLGGGVFNIAEVSLEDPADLNAFQPGAFTLATITFNPIVSALGVTFGIACGDTSLGDAAGDPLACGMAVPAPATLLIAGLGLVVIGVWSRRDPDAV